MTGKEAMNNYTGRHFAPLAIMTDEAQLRHEAQAAHQAWFAEPDSLEAKHRYAAALRRWAIEARNKTAREHADKLLAGEI